MGFKYQGDSTIGVSLTVQTPKPLDTRLVVDTRADLYSIPAKYAYNGMPVVCVADGNIYTLIDKNKIGEAVGWKASYESIQIITCTEQEYKKWQDNTNPDFTPKDDSQTWLHQDTYYYIYEESISDKGQYYVSYTQFEDLTNQVNKKATISALNSLSEKTDKALQDLAKVYATLNDIDSSNPESKLSKTLDNYYTKQKVDDTFVTKESLRGDGIEGDNFVFVTKAQYDTDQESLQTFKTNTETALSNKVDTNSDATLHSLTTNTIQYETNSLNLGTNLEYNGDIIAKEKNVPKILVLDQKEYQKLVENTNEDFTPKDDTQEYIHEDTYYYIREDSIEDKGYHYVLYSQFEDLTNQVNKKASKDSLNNLSQKVELDFQNLANVYATIGDIDASNKNSKISKILEQYYTKESADGVFVTKESLRGDGIEGDNFVFVTKSQYDTDQQNLNQYKEQTTSQINTKVTTNSEAQLKSISNEGTTLSIGQKVSVNGEEVALDKDVPKIIVMGQQDYDDLETKDPDVYYMTHGEEDNDSGIITSDLLKQSYYTQKQVIDIIKDVVNQLCTKNNLQFDYISSIEVEKPQNQTFDYDGSIHTLTSTDKYTVIGTGGSEPGTYTFKVVLLPGKWWTDGTNNPISVVYIINNQQ